MSGFEKILKYLPAVIFALALLVWGGVGYLYLNQNLTPFNLSHIKLPQVNLSSLTWKTYQNEFLSFEFRYPSEFIYSISSPHQPTLWEQVEFTNPNTSDQQAVLAVQINQVTPEDHRVFNLVSIGEPFTKDETSDTGSTRKVTAIPLSLNNISWVEQVLEENGQTTTVYLTTQKQDEAVYTISIFGPNDLPEQIVKTFSYTKT